MGQSRFNPRSPAFKGTLPDLLIGAKISVVTQPNAEFQMRLQAFRDDPLNAGKEQPVPKEGEWDAAVVIIGELTRPSAMKDRLKWPHGEAMLAEILTMPFEEFVQRIELECPQVRADAPPVIEAPTGGIIS